MSNPSKIKSDTTSITSSPAQHDEASISACDHMTERLWGKFCGSAPLAYRIAPNAITVVAVSYRSIRTVPINPSG